ncbi:MAG: serine hydrolase domain-containing protein [Dehalococcoidia bacterium]
MPVTTPLPIAARPEDVGVDPEKLEAVFARAKRDVDDGTLPGCQVAIARQGKLAGFRAFGVARIGEQDVPATTDTLYTVFSSTKGIVSAAAWLLIEDGLLDITKKVADYIPQFGTNGKDVVTVEQAFLHIGGFPLAPLGPADWGTREQRLEAFARWRLTFEPGTKFEYHPTSLHWVLAEIIERETGVEWREYVRNRLLEPMGLDHDLYVGLPAGENGRVADVYHVTPPVPPPGGWGEVTPDAILRFNRPGVRAVGVPGGGGIGTAAGLAMFYQPLINGGLTHDRTRIMKAETIDFATKVRTDDRHVDFIHSKPVNRGLGVVVAGDSENMVYRGFGRTASARAFGHAGAGGQVAWGDPETGISVGYTTHGFVDMEPSARRTSAISSLAGSCALS